MTDPRRQEMDTYEIKLWVADCEPDNPTVITLVRKSDYDAEVTRLLTALTAAEQRATDAKTQLEGYEEREVACCPEDVGFEEFIPHLQKRIAAAEQARDEWKQSAEAAIDANEATKILSFRIGELKADNARLREALDDCVGLFDEIRSSTNAEELWKYVGMSPRTVVLHEKVVRVLAGTADTQEPT